MSTLSASLMDGTLLAQQIKLEEEAVKQGELRYWEQVAEAIRRGAGGSLKPMQYLQLQWFPAMRKRIVAEKRACSAGEGEKDRVYYGPFIRRLPAEVLALITMDEVLDLLAANPAGVGVFSAAVAIGRGVMAELNTKRARMERVTFKRKDGTEGSCTKSVVMRGRFKSLCPAHINWWARQHLDEPVWNDQAKTRIGAALLKILIETATIELTDGSFEPAFRVMVLRESAKKERRTLLMSDALSEALAHGHRIRRYLRPQYLPMIVEPLPWVQVMADDGTKMVEGGYVSIRTPFVSNPLKCQKAAYANASMNELLECVTAVASTPCRVDRDELALVKSFYEKHGGDMIGLPPRDPTPLPPKPADIDTNAEAEKQWKIAASKVYDDRPEEEGERENFEHALAVAEAMQVYDRIYDPPKLDHRSRAVSVPTHLNMYCADPIRGMLTFGESVPMTEDGWYWLRVHAANCYGVDKVSFDERVDWTYQNEKLIKASARDPEGEEFWMRAEDPWQFHSACKGFVDEGHASRMMVGMDGTCSGLQHYAALGLDEKMAALVNLLPSDKPSDVYSAVASELALMVAEDCAAGERGAQLASGHISRKPCKPGTMTYCYDVRDYGLRDQFIAYFTGLGFGEEDAICVAAYLAPRLRKAIGTKCQAAANIMEWWRVCGTITTETGRTVQWTTPLGFPVVQPYFNLKMTTIKTEFSELRLKLPDEERGIDRARQIRSMIPGIVHSLDATHMWMTGRAARRNNIAYRAVHDKFYTHPSHIPILNRVVREEWVTLYSIDHLASQRQEWEIRYGVKLPPPPARGKLHIPDILRAPYAFS